PPADGVAPAVAADGAPTSPPREDRGGRPPRERFQGKGRDNDRQGKFEGKSEGKPGGKPQDRPPGKFGGGRDRDKGGGRDKGGFGGKGGRDSGPSHRQWATSAAPRERDRPVDPNSPFAKLAALKEQLAANRKD
ncbi:MAG: helicase, partial [Pseudomonadota bacterium]